MSRPQRVQHADVPGLAARRIALDILDRVLRRHRPLDDHFDGEHVHLGLAALADRDRALVRKLVATVLAPARHTARPARRLRSTGEFPRTRRASNPSSASAPRRSSGSMCRITPPSIWRSGWRRRTDAPRGTPGWSTRCCDGSPATASPPIRSETLDTPAWLMARWSRHYGPDLARAIADAHRSEPPLDLTVKDERRQLGRTAARPRAADRNGAAGRARAGRAPAGL